MTPGADRRSYGGIFFRRVGTGQSKARCGEIFYSGACSDPHCKEPAKAMPHSCDRYECPTCYHHAIRRGTKRSADRLNSFPKELKEETGLGAGNLKHYVFTFDPQVWTRERCIKDAGQGMMKMLDKALKYAAKDGFYALEAMIHLQRERHKDGSYCDREDCQIPASEHIWTWGSHVHAVGYAHLMDTKELHGNPNFRTINIIQVKEKPGQKRDAFATLYYQATHASVFYYAQGVKKKVKRKNSEGQIVEMIVDMGGKQAAHLIKHLGFISPRLYIQKVDHTYEVQTCEECGQPMKVYSVKLDMSPDRTIDYGPLYERKPVYAYSFNQRRLNEWVRNRDQLGRLWLSRRAKALHERFDGSESLTPEGSEREPDPEGGYPHVDGPAVKEGGV